MSVLREYAAAVTQPTLSSEVLGAGTSWDEVVAPDGGLRPAWQGMAGTAVGLTAEDLQRVQSEVSRMLADDGVTYSRPGQAPGPWPLDPFPVVLEAAEWAGLQGGLAQRAELLSAVLTDLYGERRLVTSGTVPPAVVLGHPGFTRTVARASATDDRPLLLTGTDLGRDAAGTWRVLADRTQAPSGLGYAMENRRVVSRVVPELYREAGLHRMEPYFGALRAALLEAAPEGAGGDPRVVVLTPGTASETAYDQAFVASHLGLPLVQGADLTVRDGQVWMKVFGRTERVDVILRRVDTAWSDPLELRGDSQLGVAGLVECVRRGTVRVVNGLGAGVLENPALLPYLPAACELLLGEELRIPSVDAWWCGDPASREHVLANLDTLDVRTLDAPLGTPRATRPATETLRRRIAADPHRYVGVAPLPLSTSPTLVAGVAGSVAAERRPIVLRTFTLRHGSAWRPLAGGLATTYESAGEIGTVAGTKDVWVLKAASTDVDQGLGDIAPVTPMPRAGAVTLPRILEDMLWVGRYAERAEDLLRLVLVVHALHEDRRRPAPPAAAPPASSVLDETAVVADPVAAQADPTTDSAGQALAVLLSAIARLSGHWQDDPSLELRSVLLDAGRAGSVAQALTGLREAAQGVRDQLSLDTWRAFAVTDRAAQGLTASPWSHQVAESAGEMLTGILSLHGVTASMIRDPGWHMIAVGHALERSMQVLQLLRATAVDDRGVAADRQVLTAVLTASESSVTHRRRYRGQVLTRDVLELLLQDPDNPRGVAFSLRELGQHLRALPASTGSTRPERLVQDLTTQLEEADPVALSHRSDGGRPVLVEFLDAALAQLDRIGETVADLHLASGPRPRAFGVFSPPRVPAATRLVPVPAGTAEVAR